MQAREFRLLLTREACLADMEESKTDGSIHRYPTKFWLSSPASGRIYGEYHFPIGSNAVNTEDLPEPAGLSKFLASQVLTPKGSYDLRHLPTSEQMARLAEMRGYQSTFAKAYRQRMREIANANDGDFGPHSAW